MAWCWTSHKPWPKSINVEQFNNGYIHHQIYPAPDQNISMYKLDTNICWNKISVCSLRFDLTGMARHNNQLYIVWHSIQGQPLTTQLHYITEICAELLLARWARILTKIAQQGIWGQWLGAMTHEDAGWPGPAWAHGLTQLESYLILQKKIPLQAVDNLMCRC